MTINPKEATQCKIEWNKEIMFLPDQKKSMSSIGSCREKTLQGKIDETDQGSDFSTKNLKARILALSSSKYLQI